MFSGSAAVVVGLSWVAFIDIDLDAHRMPTRYFALPIQLAAASRARVDHVVLHVSADRGKTWHRVDRAAPDHRRFAFLAPKEGVYWFRQQLVAKDQRGAAARLVADAPGIVKVMVVPDDSASNVEDIELRSRIAAVERRIVGLEHRVEQLELRARLRRLERLAEKARSAADSR
jgi:hypothetical protein